MGLPTCLPSFGYTTCIYLFLKMKFCYTENKYSRPSGRLPFFRFKDVNFLCREWQLTKIYTQFSFTSLFHSFFHPFNFYHIPKTCFHTFLRTFSFDFLLFSLSRFPHPLVYFSYPFSINMKHQMCRKKIVAKKFEVCLNLKILFSAFFS